MIRVPRSLLALALTLVLLRGDAAAGSKVPALPPTARLALSEDWASGKIDPAKWYVPRKKWGDGNNGVTPANVRIERDTVNGREQSVLVCQANGDRYTGPIVGLEGKKTRVGGMVVTKEFFASGRYEVVMKIGSRNAHPGGPLDPSRPIGTVPAIWTYAYRLVSVPRAQKDQFVREVPLYNPLMQAYGGGNNEYWSEIDFPEYGSQGSFETGLYNTFLQNKHESRVFDASRGADGEYHTFTTEWRTRLDPIAGVTDAQVVENEGYWWIQDKAIPFEKYYGNPLKRLGPDRYAVYVGERAEHWIDGTKVGENLRFVPSMAAQLTMGIWLPVWGGEAPWETATVSFASVKIWQYNDPGDVRGVLTKDLPDGFDAEGRPLPNR